MRTSPTYKLTIVLLLAMLLPCARDSHAQNYAITAEQVDSLVMLVQSMPDDTVKAWNLARICSNHPNVDSTLKYAQELFSLSYKIGIRWKALAYKYLGWYCQVTDDPESALKYYMEAYNINDSLGIAIEKALNSNSIGENYETLGDLNSANKYFMQAMELMSSENSPLVSYTYRNLGIVYNNFKIFDAAIKYFNDALKSDAQNNMEVQVMIDHYYLAMSYLSRYLDKPDKAHIEHAKKHSDIAIKMAKDHDLDFYVMHTSICALRTNYEIAKLREPSSCKPMLDSCLALYDDAVQIAKNDGLYESQQVDLGLCKFQHQLITGQYDEAKNTLDFILEYTKDNPSYKNSYSDIYQNCIDYNLAVGDYEQALIFTEKFNLAEKQTFDISFNESSIKSNAMTELDMEMRKRQLDEQKREIMFHEHQKHMSIIIGFILLSLLTLSVLAIAILRNSRRRHNMNVVLLRKKEEFKKQRDLLSIANYEATSSIRYAKQIQNAIVPSPEIIKSIFGDNLIIWRPVEIVSGDFYWATQIGRYKFIAVADCTGHGVPGAFMSMLGMTSLNDIVSSCDIDKINAAVILDKLRKKINTALHQSEDNGMSLDGMDIALGIIDTDSMKIQYAGAYIPLIIIRNGQINMFYADKMPIGYMPKGSHPFTNNIINLQHDDVIYLYTDGIANQFSSEEHGNKFTASKLNDILMDNYDCPFDEQREIIDNALDKWRTSSLGYVCKQTDDMLIIGIRI